MALIHIYIYIYAFFIIKNTFFEKKVYLKIK